MDETTKKFWAKLISAVLGAVLAGIGQFYTDPATMPEWARLTMVIGGGLVSVIGASLLGISGVKKYRAVDKNGDGIIQVPDELVEDEDPKSGRTHLWLLWFVVATAMVFCFSGCSTFEMHKFDPMTAEQIQKTIEFEKSDFALVEAVLKVITAGNTYESLLIRHESEIARLQAWLLAEQAKQIEESK